jgi:hypothetical protein
LSGPECDHPINSRSWALTNWTTENLFSYITARTSYISMRWWSMLSALLTRPICLVLFLECEFTDRKGKTWRSTRTHYPDCCYIRTKIEVLSALRTTDCHSCSHASVSITKFKKSAGTSWVRVIFGVLFLECEFTDRKGKTWRSTRTHYPDSAPTSLMMDVYWKNIKYQELFEWAWMWSSYKFPFVGINKLKHCVLYIIIQFVIHVLKLYIVDFFSLSHQTNKISIILLWIYSHRHFQCRSEWLFVV